MCSGIDWEYVEEIFIAAREFYQNGIYVRTVDMHPCGWDFISFERLDWWNERIDIEDISCGVYDYHDLDGLTLHEIIIKVGKDGWCYEISKVHYLQELNF